MTGYKRVAAYIDLDAVEANFESMRANLKEGTKMAGSCKANGYGHGSASLSRVLEEKEYLWGFAVATIEEALELRKMEYANPF